MFFKKPIQAFNNMKMNMKLIITFIFVAVIPIVIVSYILLNNTINAVLTETSHVDLITDNQIKDNLQDELTKLFNICHTILYDEDIRAYLEKEYTSQDDNAVKLKDFNKINTTYTDRFVLFNNSQIKLHFYTNNPNIDVDSDLINEIDSQMVGQTWYKEIIRNKNKDVIKKPYISNNGKMIFSIGRQMYSQYYEKYIRILLIEIDESDLYKFIAREAENKEIYLLDNSNDIITSTNRDAVGKNIREINGLESKINNKFTLSGLNNKKNKYITQILNLNDENLEGWRVVSFTSTQELSKKIKGVELQEIIVSGFVILIAIIFILVFSRGMTRRLKLLVRNMSNIKAGEFEVFVDFEDKDEIGDLSRSFKKMITRIDNLITEVYDVEMKAQKLLIEKKIAEMHALQSQINPHFVFNTMESIRMSLVIKKDFELAEIVESYAYLLRECIDWSQDEITLRQELKFVNYYLKIQKFRYNDKMNFNLDIKEELLDMLILKFTLQPIIENAIYHGIEMKEGKANLEIFINIVQNLLKIVVIDDGIGIEENELIRLKSNLSPKGINGKRGVGLRNVEQRIKLFYGEEYGITIDSTKGLGTSVEITLPVKFGGGERLV